MGEKEIRPTPPPGGPQVSTTPGPEVPHTVERPGTSTSLDEQLRQMGLGGVADALKMAADAAGVAAGLTGQYESPPLKGGWRVGRDAKGVPYAVDPQGVRGNWNGATGQFVDPGNAKPFPTGWGRGLVP